MIPTEASQQGWSLVPVTLDSNTNNFEFTIGGSPIPGFNPQDFFNDGSTGIFAGGGASLTTSMAMPDMPNNIGDKYEVVSHYTGASGAATGITAKAGKFLLTF